MKKPEDNIDFKLKLKFILVIIISTLMFSCGPRSGVHEDKVEPEAWCGTKSAESEFGPVIASGGKLFKQNCAVCHTNSDLKLTGVGLAGIADRLPAPAEEYFVNFTLNNEKVYNSGDAYAKKLRENNISPMPVFDSVLTEQDVRFIYQYLTSPVANQTK